jgi:hypothetical protein
MSANGNRIINDLIVPTLLFTSAGFFGWAVRGTFGYGAIPGSTFAGTCFAITWYFLNKHCTADGPRRRYSSGWAVFGIIVGIGINGMHGWMQYQKWDKGVFPMNPDPALYIDPWVGYVWWFIAALPWAGTCALLVGWAGAQRRYTWKEWLLRIAMGAGGLFGALGFRFAFPQLVLPNYHLGIYSDLSACSGCREALEDTGTALAFFGAFMGLLLFEILQKDWANVKLALIVGVTTALWWMLFQAINIQQYKWRYFEAWAGVGIGVGFGLAFYACNAPVKDTTAGISARPNAERVLGVYFALAAALVFSVYQAITGAVELAVGTDTGSLAIWLLVVIGGGGIAIWVWSLVRTVKHPLQARESEGKAGDFDKLFLVAYAILHACGFLVNFADSKGSPIGPEFAVYYALLAAADFVVLWAIKQRRAS